MIFIQLTQKLTQNIATIWNIACTWALLIASLQIMKHTLPNNPCLQFIVSLTLNLHIMDVINFPKLSC